LRSFEYIRPRALEDVIAILEKEGVGARVLAGGTDLLVRIRMGHVKPRVVVDIKDVAALRLGIVEMGSSLRVASGSTMTDLMEDSRIREYFPALVEAASVVGSVQIRNRATLAGNMCNASPAADTAPALLVYRASVNMVARSGRRQVLLEDFFLGPGKTVLQPGELVESIDLPIDREPTGAAFGRITRRWGVDLATINLCSLVKRSGETRFAYGAVGPRPFLVSDDSGVLASPTAGSEKKRRVIERLVAQATPRSDLRGSQDYRRAMLSVMSHRTLNTAIGRMLDAERAA
jgi:CO/xanthine dehydrogenase FAD-binding subunit